MNIAELAIRKKVVTMVMTFLLVFGGLQAFDGLSRLEDPEFTIKEAVILTPYPGASAQEVEEEVSNRIEMAIQQMGQLEYVESINVRGFSEIKVTIRDEYDKNSIQQVWDELRRKVGDAQGQLPPGAGPSIVNDDFGDVYGVYLAITGEGYSYAELRETAKMLRRELLHAKDVKKVVLWGDLTEVIYVEMNRQKMANLGISQENIYAALSDKNLAVDAGKVKVGNEFITISSTGEFSSEEEFGDLLISQQGADTLIYLKDVADIKRGYVDPAKNYTIYNGQPAIALGISTISGGNVVDMGEALVERFKVLESMIPLGMEIHPVYVQSDMVTKSINGFLVNLVEAVVIVVIVLLIFMGLRSGLIIGAILFITICGTFIFMRAYNVTLERISLGALIISLGMLVDNAIVITDGMKTRIEAGMGRIKAATEIVGQTAVPLLGATVVAIVAFAAIGVSQDSTGEYCRTLFQVILIALSLSWVTAVTITPLFCKMFLKGKPEGEAASAKKKDPYEGKIYQVYKNGLEKAIRFKWVTIGIVVGLFFLAIMGFGRLSSEFFPESTTPQFMVDVWLPQGTHIEETRDELMKAQEYLMGIEGVDEVILNVGGGDLRYMLTYSPERPNESYGKFLINVKDAKRIDGMIPDIYKTFEEQMPDAIVGVKKVRLGPGDGGKMQLRIIGPDHNELRKLAGKVKAILEEDGECVTIRDEWMEKVKLIRPVLSEQQARRIGLTRTDISRAIQETFQGVPTGIFRERDELIPIMARSPEEERKNVDSINNVQVWSPILKRSVPIGQVISGFETVYEDARVWRRDRTPMLRLHFDPKQGVFSADVMARVKPRIEKELNVDVETVLGKRIGTKADPFGKKYNADTIPIKYMEQMPLKGMPGYSIGWDGEAESSSKAQAALASSLPKFVLLMILIVIFLFNAFKQPIIIWLCVPLVVIGVVLGLTITNQPFGFMALLGLLSLSGMLIKNAIVLLDEIDSQIRSGKDKYNAVIDSGISRMMPVAMASLTTMLGMIPLFTDAFFISMAVTIVFGLGFATVLTLVLVPVLYTIFFKIPSPGE